MLGQTITAQTGLPAVTYASPYKLPNFYTAPAYGAGTIPVAAGTPVLDLSTGQVIPLPTMGTPATENGAPGYITAAGNFFGAIAKGVGQGGGALATGIGAGAAGIGQGVGNAGQGIGSIFSSATMPLLIIAALVFLPKLLPQRGR